MCKPATWFCAADAADSWRRMVADWRAVSSEITGDREEKLLLLLFDCCWFDCCCWWCCWSCICSWLSTRTWSAVVAAVESPLMVICEGGGCGAREAWYVAVFGLDDSCWEFDELPLLLFARLAGDCCCWTRRFIEPSLFVVVARCCRIFVVVGVGPLEVVVLVMIVPWCPPFWSTCSCCCLIIGSTPTGPVFAG